MTPEPAPDQARSTAQLRAALRRGLVAALKTRDAEALAALRTTIAAIDNAEAITAADTQAPLTSADIVGASSVPASWLPMADRDQGLASRGHRASG